MNSIKTASARWYIAGFIVMGALPSVLLQGNRGIRAGPIPAPRIDQESIGSPLAVGQDQASRQSVSAPCGTGPFDAPPGREFTYGIEVESWTELAMGTAASGTSSPEKVRSLVRGGMVIQVVARRDEEILLALRFLEPNVSLGRNGNESSDCSSSLAKSLMSTTLLRMNSWGEVLGFRFQPDVSAGDRNFIRSVLTALRFIVPGGNATERTVDEADAMGVARVHYTRLDVPVDIDLRRTKERYLDSAGTPSFGGIVRLHGDAVATIGSKAGWLIRARVDESVDVEVPDLGLRVHSSIRALLDMTSIRDGVLLPSCTGWEGPWSSIDGKMDADLTARDVELQRWGQDLRGVTLNDLVKEISDLVLTGHVDSEELYAAMHKLAWLVRIDPSAADGIRELLISGAVPEQVGAMLLAAMGAADTTHSQAILGLVLADAALGDGVRIAATQSLFQVSHLDPSVAQGVFELLHQETAPTALQGVAVLLYGACAGRGGDGAEAMLENLLGLEKEVERQGLLDAWLAALGNTGKEGVISLVAPHLQDPDAHIRMAAVDALGSLEGGAAVQVLLSCSREDPSPEVRVQAAYNLATNPSPQAVQAIESLLQTDPDSVIRQAVLQGLASHLASNPALVAIVQWSAIHDPSGDLRSQAQQMLSELHL